MDCIWWIVSWIIGRMGSGKVSSSHPRSSFKFWSTFSQRNFFEYLEVVHDAMGRQGNECNLAIEEALFDIEVMIEANDIEGLQESFRLCTPFDGKLEDDTAFFIASLV